MDIRLNMLQEDQVSGGERRKGMRQEVGEKLEGPWKRRECAGERRPVTAECGLEVRARRAHRGEWAGGGTQGLGSHREGSAGVGVGVGLQGSTYSIHSKSLCCSWLNPSAHWDNRSSRKMGTSKLGLSKESPPSKDEEMPVVVRGC